MVWFVRIVAALLSDAFRLVLLLLRSSAAIRAENLVLRKQLAQYIERGIKPRRVDSVTRISLALLTRLFDWQNAVVIVRPKTIIRWHRTGWRLFWRFKCKLGRPPIPAELRALIRRMSSENPVWGEGRIANELLVKLGIRVSPRTVGKYMPKGPEGQPRGDRRWSTFLRIQLREAAQELGSRCTRSTKGGFGDSEFRIPKSIGGGGGRAHEIGVGRTPSRVFASAGRHLIAMVSR